jgi:hypothetical protein
MDSSTASLPFLLPLREKVDCAAGARRMRGHAASSHCERMVRSDPSSALSGTFSRKGRRKDIGVARNA